MAFFHQLYGMAAITKNHKNGYHEPTIQYRHFQKKKKLNTSKFGPNLNSNISVILDGNHYPKSQKFAAMTLPFNTETCNNNWILMLKIDLIMCEPPLCQIYCYSSYIVQLFDVFDIWNLSDNFLFTYRLNHDNPSKG